MNAGLWLNMEADYQLHLARKAEAAVRAFAGEQGIHPGIVVGMLPHDGILPWAHLNGVKQKYCWN